jgi:hypothetical protein
MMLVGFQPGHCQLVELRVADVRVERGFGHRVDLRSGARTAAVAVPVTWFQVVNRVPISRRYSSAVNRGRRGRKCSDIPLKADRNRCACPAQVNRFIARSRCRVGWCEFRPGCSDTSTIVATAPGGELGVGVRFGQSRHLESFRCSGHCNCLHLSPLGPRSERVLQNTRLTCGFCWAEFVVKF